MFGPARPQQKLPTPSVCSIDSGYSTCPSSPDCGTNFQEHDLNCTNPLSNFPVQEGDNVALHTPNSSIVQTAEALRPPRSRSTINPLVTKLNTFSFIDEVCRIHDVHTTANIEDEHQCGQYRNSHSVIDSDQIQRPRQPSQPSPHSQSPIPSPSNTNGVQSSIMSVTKTRCSACDLAAIANPNASQLCSSCAPLTSSEPKVRRSRAGRNSKLPIRALSRLQTWLDAHQDNPYPSADMKRQLAQECGITEKQVTTWFTNARARKLNRAEHWHSSASEDEVTHESDMGDLTPTFDGPGRYTAFTDQSIQGNRDSISAPSAFASISPNTNRQVSSRRGKKKNYRRNHQPRISDESTTLVGPVMASGQIDDTSNGQDTWQCTFCLRHLVPKSWRRHEETQHRPRTQWTCMLFGPRLSYAHRPGSRCAFCMAKEPTEDHFHTHHRISECARRPIQERTFFRPDHLRQHIKNFHGSTLYDITQSKWKKATEAESSGWTCGFCGEDLSTWDQREKHIANHFKEGMTMEQWKHEGTSHDCSHTHEAQPFAPQVTTSLPQQTIPQPPGFDFAAAPGISAAPSYFSSAAPPLPDLNADPLADMCGADFFNWPQATQALDAPIQYPIITDSYDRNFLPGPQGEFENALDTVLGTFSHGVQGAHQSWSGV